MQKLKTDKMLSQLGRLSDEQFKVLFFIYNSINLNSDHTNRAKIYRAVLADLTGKSERTISRITDKLAEQGLIIKDCVSDGTKLYNYYGIPKQKIEGNLVTDDRVKEPKELESTKRTEKNLKEQKRMKREFETACDEQVVTVPSEEDLGDYLRRVGRM
jgi:DNA-binding transcriptional ArsR family regulator